MSEGSNAIAWRKPAPRPLGTIDRALAAHYHEHHKMPVDQIARLLRITERDALDSINCQRGE